MGVRSVNRKTTSKFWIVSTLFIVCAMIFDASVEDMFAPDFSQRSSFGTLVIFILISVLFLAFEYFIILFLAPYSKSLNVGHTRQLYWLIISVHVLLTSLIVAIVLEMIFTQRYNIYLVSVITWGTLGSGVIILSYLAYKFFFWFKSNRSLVVLFYGLGMAMLSVNIIFATLYLSIGLSNKPSYITPFRDPLGAFSNSDYFSSTGYNVTDITSFILIWISTVLLLYHYSKKVGRGRYWLMVSIPLLFFISQFQGIFIDSMQNLALQNPFIYNTVFTLIFNSTNPIGGILFGMAVWTIARRINSPSLRTYLSFCAMGLMLLFGTKQATTIISAPYPPFGIPSVSFVGLASYLILIGFYYSAYSIAKDNQLRQNIRASLQQETRMLHSIGSAEMEEELVRRFSNFKSVLDKADLDSTGIGIESSMGDSEIRNYIQDVMKEIKLARKGQEKE